MTWSPALVLPSCRVTRATDSDSRTGWQSGCWVEGFRALPPCLYSPLLAHPLTFPVLSSIFERSSAVKRDIMAAPSLGMFYGFVLFLGTLISEGKWRGGKHWAHLHWLSTECLTCIHPRFYLSCAWIQSALQWIKSLHVQDKTCTHALVQDWKKGIAASLHGW